VRPAPPRYVPFVQIHQEEHKAKVGTPSRYAMIEVYFTTAAARDTVREHLAGVRREMLLWVAEATETMKKENLAALKESGKTPEELDAIEEKAMNTVNMLRMDNGGDDGGSVVDLDEFTGSSSWGLHIPERLFWEAFVTRQNISRPEGSGWETGRPSVPGFMDMNIHATRCPDKKPRAVVWQHDQENPLNPCSLLVAYAEKKVLAVVSDFDAFLVGSKGMAYEPLPDDQVETLTWCVDQIESVLSTPSSKGWCERWLDVLKHAADAGYHPHIPPYGFGDPTSYEIQSKCVERLNMSGAVRHGAECFNFYFPQDLDEELLVIWSGFGARPWKYFTQPELRQFLFDRVQDGYSFPINPKWMLCDDPEWLQLLTKLEESPSKESRAAIEAWFPVKSNLRERIRSIREQVRACVCVVMQFWLVLSRVCYYLVSVCKACQVVCVCTRVNVAHRDSRIPLYYCGL